MNIGAFANDLLPKSSEERIMASSTFINTFGNGLFSVTSAIYFTRVVGVTPLQLGFAFSLAAGIGLAMTLPMGHLADRISPKTLNITLGSVSAFGMAFYAAASTYAMFLVVAMLLAISEQGGRAARSTLIARLGSDNKVRFRAYQRAVTNLGIALGSLLGGVALVIDDPKAYRAIILADALTTLIASQFLRKLPDVDPIRHEVKPRRTEAMRDHAYVILTFVNAGLGVHFMLLELIVPLWIINRTQAPTWVAAGTYLVNTIACVLFTVRVAKGAEDLRGAARLQRSGGLWLGIGALSYASAAYTGSWWLAALVMLTAAGVHVFGELQQSAASFGIGFNLPPEHLQGQYQGVWSLGWGIMALIGPTWLTYLVFHLGAAGWLILAAQFVVLGAITPRLVERALSDPRRSPAVT